MATMGEFKIGINNRLYDKARAEVDCVRFLSVDHICNIALAEWLARKVKQDEAEKRRKEKAGIGYQATIRPYINDDEGENEKDH
jgi:hypothetical protein